MATQRITLMKIVGDSGRAVMERCRELDQQQQRAPDDPNLKHMAGRLAETLTERRTELPTPYCTEWIDRWSMGDTFAKPFSARGGVLEASGRFDLLCYSERPEEMLTLASSGWQHDEQAWLATRLREAATAWQPLVEGGVLILLREVIGPTTTDEDVTAALHGIPRWLAKELGATST